MAQSTTPRLRSQLHRLQSPTAPQPELGLEGVLPKAIIIQILKGRLGRLGVRRIIINPPSFPSSPFKSWPF